MFDWFDKISDPAWAAIVTGAFLSAQQILNNRREDRRRQEDTAERARERKHQECLEEDARRAAKAEVWRAERREAHMALLALAQTAVNDLAFAFASQFVEGVDGEAESSDMVEVVTPEQRVALRDAMAVVEMVGSEGSRWAARKLQREILQLHQLLWMTSAGHIVADSDSTSRIMTYRGLQTGVSDLMKTLEIYKHSVRVDIGTSN